MCDGRGIAASTTLTIKENPGKTQAQIEQIVLDYLGIHTYHLVPDALGQYIEHIDCWGKFLGPDKIMIMEVPSSSSIYQKVENAAAYWASATSSYGTPFQVFRVYTPNGEPYTNSLILNNKVLVPQTGSSWDDDAIQAYEDAMPGYEVLGFTGSWQTTDALHCRTHEIADREMLEVFTKPLVLPAPDPQGFYVEAEILSHGGHAFVNNTPTLYWRLSGGTTWNAVAMTHTGTGDFYEAWIPPQPNSTQVEYYVLAEDASGRIETHPYQGDLDPIVFTVYDPIFGSDVTEISARDGGLVNFSLDAGAANGGRDYFILGTLSGTSPGLPLPGGQVILPVNYDVFTGLVASMLNTAIFDRFLGQLDAAGQETARFDTFGPLPGGLVGLSMHFAYALAKPFDFVSPAVKIDIVQ